MGKSLVSCFFDSRCISKIGRSNLTQGRIVAQYGSFSYIRQVAPICTPPPSDACLFGPTVCCQTAAGSVLPYLQGSPVCPTDKQARTDDGTGDMWDNRPQLRHGNSIDAVTCGDTRDAWLAADGDQRSATTVGRRRPRRLVLRRRSGAAHDLLRAPAGPPAVIDADRSPQVGRSTEADWWII